MFAKVRLISFLILIGTPSLMLAQFKVEPKESLFGFDEEKKWEYYSPLRYNRCDGLVPAFGITRNFSAPAGLSFSADLGYALAAEKIRFNLSAEYHSAEKTVKAGVRYFHDTFTNDNWIISSLENSFAALLLHEDFMDYFDARGMQFWLQRRFSDWLQIRVAAEQWRYTSLSNETDWSLFGKNKVFRPNPAVAEGIENRFRLEWILDRLDNPIFPLSGYFVEGAVEAAPEWLGGDLQQFGLFVTAKYFLTSIGNQRMVFLGRYGLRRSTDAPQHLLDLGGIGTLRGYRFKEFRDGHNLAFLSCQYYFNGDLLQKLPFQWLPFYSSLGLILFAEMGSLWDAGADVARPLSDQPEWKSDIGFSLAVTGDILRVDFARRLDRSRSPWVVTFRVLSRW